MTQRRAAPAGGTPSLQLASDGWLTGIRQVPSPNFDARPADASVELIVIHNISLPRGCYRTGNAERLFTNALDTNADPTFEPLAGLRVSAHFLIERDGDVVQFVSCRDRAWHAGVSEFDGRSRCNDFSVGIELEGCDDDPYEDAQYASLQALLDVLIAAYPVRAVRGHCHIAPARKTDPGASFDWNRLRVAPAVSLP